MPNDGGIRRALVERLKQIKAPVIRWPGGCFADSYDWRDGIGPRANRRDAHELLGRTPRCRRRRRSTTRTASAPSSSRASASWRARSRTSRRTSDRCPRAIFYQWIEFCNSPAGTTTLAGVRAAEGSPDPLNVVYWGVGNEPWGCGGDFSPEDYAVELKRYTAWVPSLRPAAALHRRRRQQRRRRVDAPLLRQAHRRKSRDGRTALGLLVPSLRVEREQRQDDGLERGQGTGRRLHARAALRVAARRRQDGRLHHRALAGDGRVRSSAEGEAGRGRMGRVAQARQRVAPVAHARPESRPCATRCWPGSRSTRFNRHADKVGMAEHRAARELPAVAVRRARVEVHRRRRTTTCSRCTWITWAPSRSARSSWRRA